MCLNQLHFIMHSLFDYREELKRWFIQQEMDLFRYRFNQLSHPLVEKFLQYANLGYDTVSTVYLNNSIIGFSFKTLTKSIYEGAKIIAGVGLLFILICYFFILSGVCCIIHTAIIIRLYSFSVSQSLSFSPIKEHNGKPILKKIS